MTILTALDRFFERLFDRPTLRHAIGVTSIVVGVLNILDMSSGLSSVLTRGYGLHSAVVIAYMLLIALSGGIIILHPAPLRWWYLPLISYLFMTFVGYVSGAVIGVNSWPFALKALFSVGLAWWLLIRLVRRGDL